MAGITIDPSLSQEEQDLRLALALQQEENNAAYDAQKKSHEEKAAAQKMRTGRSGVNSGLAHIRKVQRQSESVEGAGAGMYTAPQGDDHDASLAMELQKAEQATAGVLGNMEKMSRKDAEIAASSQARNARHAYKK